MDPPLEKPEPKMADCSTHRFSSIHVWIALCVGGWVWRRRRRDKGTRSTQHDVMSLGCAHVTFSDRLTEASHHPPTHPPTQHTLRARLRATTRAHASQLHCKVDVVDFAASIARRKSCIPAQFVSFSAVNIEGDTPEYVEVSIIPTSALIACLVFVQRLRDVLFPASDPAVYYSTFTAAAHGGGRLTHRFLQGTR